MKNDGRGRYKAWIATAMLVATTTGATGVFAAPSDASRTVALKVYQEGTQHYKAGRLVEALAAFKASYDMVPSPNSHLMIARTLRDRGELVDAYLEYDKLVPEAEAASEHDLKYKKTATTARDEKLIVRAQIALVRLRVKSPPDDLRVAVGSRSIARRDWEMPIPAVAGTVAIRADSSTLPAQHREVTTTAGSDVEVTFDFAPPPPPPPEPVATPAPVILPPKREVPPDIPREPIAEWKPVDRTWAKVFLGVSAAGLATFVVFGALNESTFHDLQSACPDGHCPPGRSDDVSKGRAQQAVANVGLGVGLVGGGLAAILFVTAAERERHENAHGTSWPRLTGVGIGPGSVTARGAF